MQRMGLEPILCVCIKCLGNPSLESNDITLGHGIMTYLCTETVIISSRGPTNLSNFLFERQQKRMVCMDLKSEKKLPSSFL